MPIHEVGPDSELAVIVDIANETTEIYFYKDGDDTRPTYIAMSGDLTQRPHIEWLTEAAAKELGVQYRVEEIL